MAWLVVSTVFLLTLAALILGNGAGYVIFMSSWFVPLVAYLKGLRVHLVVHEHWLGSRTWPWAGWRWFAIADVASIDVLDRLPWRWRHSGPGWNHAGRRFVVRWSRVLSLRLVDGRQVLITVDDVIGALASIRDALDEAAPGSLGRPDGPRPDRRHDAP